MCELEWDSIFLMVSSVGILATVIVNCFMIRISVKDLKQRGEEYIKMAKQNAWENLFSAFDHINNYISTKGIRDPIYPKAKSDNDNFILVFYHMNLILRYWLNKELLTDGEREGFERWINNSFLKWAEKKRNIGEDLKKIIDSKDLYPDEFLDWLKDQNGYKRV